MKSATMQAYGEYAQSSTGFNVQDRERLILEHLPQVKLIARRIHDRLPESVSVDDLVSTGTVGLINAIDRFDPTQNVKLKTYAEYKIRGAILDSLRGLRLGSEAAAQTRQDDRGRDLDRRTAPAPNAFGRRDRQRTGPRNGRVPRVAGRDSRPGT